MKNTAPKSNETDHNINVCVRIRPQRSVSAAVSVEKATQGPLVIVENATKTKSFNKFSHVVQGSDQQVAYNQIARPLLEQLRSGYSCTLCAYGQTSSGKTHSVFGPPGCLTVTSVAQRNYQDIVARQQSIRNLYRPAMDVYKTCQREVRHLQARVDMLQVS